jgi:serine/threonine protein kinase
MDRDLAEVVEALTAQLKEGKGLDLEACMAQYPQYGDELRGLFPALNLLTGLSRSGSASFPPAVSEEMNGRTAGELGDFRILSEVGRGGMGVVYEAVQISLDRRVALKVLPFASTLDAKQLQRFKNEAQAAAHLHHQSIVPVYATGCERGVHYYAMQFIEGHTLAAVIAELRSKAQQVHAAAERAPGAAAEAANAIRTVPWIPEEDRPDDSRHTAPGEALPPATLPPTMPKAGISTERSTQSPAYFRSVAQLGVQGAEALEHAHQLGIVHRDIKPANLLVDGRGSLWVTDFGLAHCQGQAGLTMSGDLVGTLRYMSPEQALAQRVTIDHRTDIYSIGATLYELLTLEPAFSGHDRQALLRQIAFEEPKSPRRLNPALPAELETIILKALEKNPAERYATAQELAEDLERYLKDEPIRARRPSFQMRLRKWMRRHRPVVATGLAAAVILLVAVTLVTLLAAGRLREQLGETKKAEELARERLEDAESNLLLARQAVDEMYTQVAGELSVQPHMAPFQRDILEKALRFYQEFARRQPDDPVGRRETASAWFRVGSIHQHLGHHRQAKQAYDEAVTELEALAKELSSDPKRRASLGNAYHARGSILEATGRRRDAEKHYRLALALHGELAAEGPNNPIHGSDLAAAHLALGNLMVERPREAEKAMRTGLKLLEELVERHSQTRYGMQLAACYIQLGVYLTSIGQPTEAERNLRQAIDLLDRPGGLPDTMVVRWHRSNAEIQLSKIMAGSKRREAAEEAYRRQIADLERYAAVIPDVPSYRQRLAICSGSLAALLERAGKREEAAQFRRRARELFDKLEFEFTDDRELRAHLTVATICLRDARDLDGAEQYARKTLTVAGKLAADNSDEPASRRDLANTHAGLAVILQRRGRRREAAGQIRQGIGILERLVSEFPDEPSYRHHQVSVLNGLGLNLRDLSDERANALQCHEEAIRLCDPLIAEFPDRPLYWNQLVRAHFGRGIVLRLMGRPAEAAEAFQQAIDVYRPYSETYNEAGSREQFASVHNEWAWMLATWPDAKYRDPDRAIALARKAVELAPEHAGFWNTLGVAAYRVQDWRAAIEALIRRKNCRLANSLPGTPSSSPWRTGSSAKKNRPARNTSRPSRGWRKGSPKMKNSAASEPRRRS